MSDQLKWLIEPLGQVWQGYVYLVAGQPGSRKSGLTLQVALDLAQRGQAAPVGGEKLDELKQQRDAVRRRTEMIVSALDEETLADARTEIERLRNERRRLDEQIAASEAAASEFKDRAQVLAD